ncbi:MAG: hypothetical protein FWD76_04690 [Firmicutes bacterium]|nr:hypothetical protein [Bacillota bacterium]
MRGIVKSTQGATKSTEQGWLARITKTQCVAVVALSLCFVFCMSFGLQAMFRDKIDPQNIMLEQRASAYQQVRKSTQSKVEQKHELMVEMGIENDAQG